MSRKSRRGMCAIERALKEYFLLPAESPRSNRESLALSVSNRTLAEQINQRYARSSEMLFRSESRRREISRALERGFCGSLLSSANRSLSLPLALCANYIESSEDGSGASVLLILLTLIALLLIAMLLDLHIISLSLSLSLSLFSRKSGSRMRDISESPAFGRNPWHRDLIRVASIGVIRQYLKPESFKYLLNGAASRICRNWCNKRALISVYRNKDEMLSKWVKLWPYNKSLLLRREISVDCVDTRCRRGNSERERQIRGSPRGSDLQIAWTLALRFASEFP